MGIAKTPWRRVNDHQNALPPTGTPAKSSNLKMGVKNNITRQKKAQDHKD